jgi:hypothetical protein
MTFKDLKLQLSKFSDTENNKLDILKNKKFWYWDKVQHKLEYQKTNGTCCFNHIVGLPMKGGREYPLFDYEKIIYDSLMIPEFNNPLNHNFKDKHLYVLKATGLGLSEIMLRFMAWFCTKDNTYKDSQMVIVTGPNWDLSIKLMKRLKAIFEPKLNIIFQDKESVLNLNGCVIESFPSNHLELIQKSNHS